MTVAAFKVGRKEFVVVRRRHYERLAARMAEDARDVRKARAAMAHYRKTKRGVSLETLKQELGD